MKTLVPQLHILLNELRTQLRDEWRHDLKLEFQYLTNTSDSEDLLRAELLHFKQACTSQEKRIQELESESDQGSRILPSVLSPVLSEQPSLGLLVFPLPRMVMTVLLPLRIAC
jgi:hypothetical protein